MNRLHRHILAIHAVAVATSALACGCAASGSAAHPRVTAAGQWVTTRDPSEAQGDRARVAILHESTCPARARDQLRSQIAQELRRSSADRARTLADLGLAAAHLGACEEAKQALDDSLWVMDATITDEEMSRRVLELGGQERLKLFKGEPHERAVCFLYRGLLYLADGEYDSAAACFRQVELQDARSTDGGTSLGSWLSASHLLGLAGVLARDADAAFPTEVPDDLDVGRFFADHDTIFVVAAGFAPRKVQEQLAKGEYGLSYAPRASEITTLTVSHRIEEPPALTSVAGEDAVDPPLITPATPGHPSAVELSLIRPTEDLYVQAVSRGRREMDRVLEAKQRLALSARGKADVAEGIGVAAAQFGLFGLPVALGAAVFSISERDKAAKAHSTADLRQIAGVPGSLFIGSFRCADGEVVLEGTDAAGAAVFSTAIAAHEPRPGAHQCRARARVPVTGQGACAMNLASAWKTALCMAFLGAAGCTSTTVRVANSPGRPTLYDDPASPGRVTGNGFESQDVIGLVDGVVRDMLADESLMADQDAPPRILIDAAYLRNESSTPIDMNLLSERLLNELNRAARSRLEFVSREYLDMVEAERELEQQERVTGGSRGATPTPLGWDYRLTGRFLSIDAIAPASGRRARSHQVTFQLWDRRGVAVWASEPFDVKKSASEGVLYR